MYKKTAKRDKKGKIIHEARIHRLSIARTHRLSIALRLVDMSRMQSNECRLCLLAHLPVFAIYGN